MFVLALGFKRATGTGAFVGLLAGMAVVAAFAFHPATSGVSFLWHNPLGVIVVVVVGLLVSLITPPAAAGGRMKIAAAALRRLALLLGTCRRRPPQPATTS